MNTDQRTYRQFEQLAPVQPDEAWNLAFNAGRAAAGTSDPEDACQHLTRCADSACKYRAQAASDADPSHPVNECDRGGCHRPATARGTQGFRWCDEHMPPTNAEIVASTIAAQAAPRKPKLLVDFDGVLHAYRRGWADGTAYDEPNPGARDAIDKLLAAGYDVVVFSTRDADQIHHWLGYWGFPGLRVTNIKEPAVGLIDDRAVRFLDWDRALAEVAERYPVR